ncbi:MAG: hypothetical protein LUE64_02880 [Candidatus Gastranaerophilales bacterium]|nr:hypothetical protein [Candidatus Gastranaerophilales bacterium]
MPFRYRLQKFLEIRIREKEAQLKVVREAQNALRAVELKINENNENIKMTRINMRQSDPRMYDGFDKFLKHLYEIGEKLQTEKKEAEENLQKQLEILKEKEQRVNVLEKHKEHKKEEYLYEEKMAELKTLNEIGSQKHFARTREAKETEEKENDEH